MKEIKIHGATLVNADSLEYLKTLPDDCINLIATDPPYYRVKDNAWDRQWESEAEYLAWLDKFLVEFQRVLKPMGSLYMFCGPRLAAKVELLIDARLNVLNHIVWAKPSGRWNHSCKESLRSYFPSNERVIFAEQKPLPVVTKNDPYLAAELNLREEVFKPIIDYFAGAKLALGVTSKEINDATGTLMSSHWFTKSQWKLPSAEQYRTLQALFQKKAEQAAMDGKTLRCPWEELEAQRNELSIKHAELAKAHNDLHRQYMSARRPFTVSKTVPFTDVWTYGAVQYYPGKHPCEKPGSMMRDIITASSRPGEIVADFFMGSGSTVKQALALGRPVIGIEMETERFNQTCDEIAALEIPPASGL